MKLASTLLILCTCISLVVAGQTCREFFRNLARARISNWLTAFPELTDEIKNGQLGPRNQQGLFNNNNNMNPNGNQQAQPNLPNNNQPNNNGQNGQQNVMPPNSVTPNNNGLQNGQTSNEIPSIPNGNRVNRRMV